MWRNVKFVFMTWHINYFFMAIYTIILMHWTDMSIKKM